MFTYRKYPGAVALRIALFFFFATTTSAFAAWDSYLGAGASISHWQMGLASGKTTQLFGLGLQSNKPDPLLYMAGISASLVYNKTWAITYQGEVGTAGPNISLSSVSYDFSVPRTSTLSAEAQVLRTDQSVALSRSLGTSGFSVYAGFKVQAFGYRQNSGRYTEVEMGSGDLKAEGPFSIEQNIINYGPAVGATYSFRIFRRAFGALQAGFIYFPGKYTADMKFTPSAFLTMNNTANEDFYGIGATSLASVIFPLSDGILLQLAIRGQYYYARTRSGSAEVKTTTQTQQTASTTMDKVQDILIGTQAAVICKIF
jgi:hypothetical protein